MTSDEKRRDLLACLILVAVAALLRLPHLGLPAEEVFDEVYHAKTALQYLEGQPPTEWVHPPTAKLLIAVGVWLFGYEPWAWRLLPALAGVALAPLFFLLARQVLETRRAALLAAALLMCDGVYLVQSRIAMTNIFAVCFQIGAALFVLRAALSPVLPVRSMLAAGGLLGLAVSTRWTSLWALGFLGLVLLALRRRRLFQPRELALTLLAFLLIPVTVYVISYVPWMMIRHQGDSAFRLAPALWDLVEEQRRVWRYHADLRASHPYFSHWYTWPWLYRPTWYHFKNEGGWIRGIVAIGNPALWWASVPVTLWALVSGLRAKDPRRLFCAVGYLCLYLPWGVSPRTLNYSHYLFEAIPYACLSLGILLDRCWDTRGGALARSYVAMVVVLFVFFFPFLAAVPVPEAWYHFQLWDSVRPWTWFPSWV
jgi:dolichyl-phosphate-mannose--protein O-mannosyl transferase